MYGGCNDQNLCWRREVADLIKRIDVSEGGGESEGPGGGETGGSGEGDPTGGDGSGGAQGASGAGQSEGASGSGQGEGADGAGQSETGTDAGDGAETGSVGDGGAPSDDGSQATDASTGSQSTSDEDFPQAAPIAGPVDITTMNYRVELENAEKNPNLWQVSKDGVSGALDLVELDTDADAIGVSFAKNADEVAGPTKLPLRSILADLWARLSGKDLSEVKSINYQIVTNKEMIETIMPGVYKIMDAPFRSPLELRPDGTKEQIEAFNFAMDSTFGGGASKFIAENAALQGRTISKVTFFTDDTDVEFFFPAPDTATAPVADGATQ